MKKIVVLKILLLTSILVYSKRYSNLLSIQPRPELAFELVMYGDPFNPLDYVPFDDWYPYVNCPGTGYICVVEVYENEIYLPTDIPIPAYWGKPKVGEGTLHDDISNALSVYIDPYFTGNLRTIWKRF
ncbi:hypothetical protein [Chitinophaga cymbidii]|uniref:Uncharacterized protein n=1 Tax=Chitinophaga cymbidii TaxID=1096750 RepID=A0A512RPZ9_9BACT|nr:hypothetical protein [Chitinophaga cymbidii]GEP97778.1 hypothetical protein CCY01nite_40380 [Chitinophaga cymbidii]